MGNKIKINKWLAEIKMSYRVIFGVINATTEFFFEKNVKINIKWRLHL